MNDTNPRHTRLASDVLRVIQDALRIEHQEFMRRVHATPDTITNKEHAHHQKLQMAMWKAAELQDTYRKTMETANGT